MAPPDHQTAVDTAAAELAERLNRLLFVLEVDDAEEVYDPQRRPHRLSEVQAKYGRRRVER